jgi:hypothetical protein
MTTKPHIPQQQLERMKHPGAERGSAIHGVIQVIVTNRCDLRCSNCTQHIAYQPERFWMTPENFRTAVESLQDYPGIVGVFGGNPCLHPQFPELCRIIAEVLPDKRRRGLWSNNVNGHGEIIRDTFGYFNLNVHGAHTKATEIHATVPGVRVWGDDHQSVHAPVLTAVSDLVPDADQMWDMIGHCDINQRWSAAITEQHGQLRAYFCEVAASFAGMYDDDTTGEPVTAGWWRRLMDDWRGQVERWCPGCGVPARLAGRPDVDQIDDISERHRERVELTVRGSRTTVIHTSMTGEKRTHEVTDYQGLRT